MNVVNFDFESVNKFREQTSDELIDNLTAKQLEKGNEKLIEMGVISDNE